jgi:hypothetical protein
LILLLGKEEIEAFGIDAAEDIKGMGADCVVMAVSHDAFKDIALGALGFFYWADAECEGGGWCHE